MASSLKFAKAGPRADTLPEGRPPPRDDGCDVNPSCFTCPLPRCKYDYVQPELVTGTGSPTTGRPKSAERDREIYLLRMAGVAAEQIAARYGLGVRTVQRAVARVNSGKVSLDPQLLPYAGPILELKDLRSRIRPRKPLPPLPVNTA